MPYISQEEYDAAIKLLNDKEAHLKLVRKQLYEIDKIRESYIQYKKELEDLYHKKEDELDELLIEVEKLQNQIHEDNMTMIKRYGRYSHIKAIVTVAIFLIGGSISLFILLTKGCSIECSMSNLILTCIGLPTVVLLLTDLSFKHCMKE